MHKWMHLTSILPGFLTGMFFVIACVSKKEGKTAFLDDLLEYVDPFIGAGIGDIGQEPVR